MTDQPRAARGGGGDGWERLVRSIEESGADQLSPLAATNLPEIPNGAPTVTLMRSDLIRFRAHHAQMLGALAVYLDCAPEEVDLFRIIQGIYATKYPEMDLRRGAEDEDE